MHTHRQTWEEIIISLFRVLARYLSGRNKNQPWVQLEGREEEGLTRQKTAENYERNAEQAECGCIPLDLRCSFQPQSKLIHVLFYLFFLFLSSSALSSQICSEKKRKCHSLWLRIRLPFVGSNKRDGFSSSSLVILAMEGGESSAQREGCGKRRTAGGRGLRGSGLRSLSTYT